MRTIQESHKLLSIIAEEFFVPYEIVRKTSEILDWAGVQPEIYYEDGIDCISLEWKCPAGYLTINVHKDRISVFKNINGVRVNKFDVTITEAIDAYQSAHDTLFSYERHFEVEDIADNQ